MNLIAFKVDAVKPSVNITTPADGDSFPLDKVVTAKFKCTDNESGIDTCVGTVANGANLDTSTIGTHTFTVTGTDKAGNVTDGDAPLHGRRTRGTASSRRSRNTEDSKLNLVHAGDLIKIGFGLNGDRGLDVIAHVHLGAGRVPVLDAALGAGRRRRARPPGLSYGVVVRPLHVRVADRRRAGPAPAASSASR